MQETEQKLKELGERIYKLRKAKKITLSGLCYQNALEPSTISRIEKGQVEAKYLTLCKISKALGMELTELLNFKNTNNS